MKSLRLRWKGVFSLGEGSISTEDLALTLITGYSKDEQTGNGSGKSSMASKLPTWVRYGETAGKIKADKVQNRHLKSKKCFGEEELLHEDGSVYRIRRERPAKLLLFKDGTDVSSSTSKETQKLIDGLLGADFKTFTQTSYFGQGREIHYPALPPKEQKAVLENILPMQEVDAWATLAEKEAKKLAPKLKELDEKFSGASGALTSLEGQYARTDKDGFLFEQQRAVKIVGAKEQLESVHESFKPSWEALGEPPPEVDLEKTINEVVRGRGQTVGWRDTNADLYREASTNEALWRSKAINLENLVDELLTAGSCPACGRLYDGESQEKVNHRLEKAREQLAVANKTQDECSDAGIYYKQEQNRFDEMIEFYDRSLEDLRVKAAARVEYDRAEELLIAKEEAAGIAAQTTLTEWENATNPHLEPLKQIQFQITEQTETIAEMEEERSTLRDEVSHLTHWRDVFGKELKLKLFEDACPFLDERTSYHLTRLNNRQIHCDFSTVKRLATGEAKEEFDVRTWSETGGDGFGSLSGGEQQMASFAIGLALADLARRVSGSDSSFLILDEPLTELCPKNANSVYEYLTAEIENGRDTIFMISNDESLKSLIHNRIHIVKSKGISNVVDHE